MQSSKTGTEIELKYAFEPEAYEEALITMGQQVRTVTQRNFFVDVEVDGSGVGALQRAGAFLRVRYERDENTDDCTVTLTLKTNPVLINGLMTVGEVEQSLPEDFSIGDWIGTTWNAFLGSDTSHREWTSVLEPEVYKRLAAVLGMEYGDKLPHPHQELIGMYINERTTCACEELAEPVLVECTRYGCAQHARYGMEIEVASPERAEQVRSIVEARLARHGIAFGYADKSKFKTMLELSR